MVWYNTGKTIMLDPRFNWGTAMPEPPFELLLDVVKVALMKTTYSINIDTDLDFGDIAASEIVATNYTSRGNALGTKAVAVDNANDRGEFDAADTVFSSLGNGSNDTFDQIVILRENDSTPTDASSPLVAHATVASTLSNGGDVTLVWNAEGILQITA